MNQFVGCSNRVGRRTVVVVVTTQLASLVAHVGRLNGDDSLGRTAIVATVVIVVVVPNRQVGVRGFEFAIEHCVCHGLEGLAVVIHSRLRLLKGKVLCGK